MADRVSVSITIGGTLAAYDHDRFVAAIIEEGVSIEWDGPAFDAGQLPKDDALRLYAHDIAWGRLETLEALCLELALPFARWSGGYGGAWSPEIVVFTDSGALRAFTADEQEHAVIDRQTVEQCGSFDAVLAYFDAADFVVPPLCLTGRAEECGGC